MKQAAIAAALFAAGTLTGAATAVAVANAWPNVRLAPPFYARNELRFGTAENGQPALCDLSNMALTPLPSGELAFVSDRIDGVLVALECRR